MKLEGPFAGIGLEPVSKDQVAFVLAYQENFVLIINDLVRYATKKGECFFMRLDSQFTGKILIQESDVFIS